MLPKQTSTYYKLAPQPTNPHSSRYAQTSDEYTRGNEQLRAHPQPVSPSTYYKLAPHLTTPTRVATRVHPRQRATSGRYSQYLQLHQRTIPGVRTQLQKHIAFQHIHRSPLLTSISSLHIIGDIQYRRGKGSIKRGFDSMAVKIHDGQRTRRKFYFSQLQIGKKLAIG